MDGNEGDEPIKTHPKYQWEEVGQILLKILKDQMGKEEAVKGNAQLYIYYCEHQHVYKILIMWTYVMTLKLVYLNMDCETFKDCWVCFFFHQMITLQKTMESLFISSKKFFLFSRYSNFCNFLPSLSHFQDSKGQMKVE